MKLSENKDVQKFLEDITAQVKFKDAHEEIKLEYLNHIEESTKLGMSYGLNSGDSTSDAIRRLGEPAILGKSLDQVHSPKIDLTIVFSVLMLGLMGVYTLSTLGFAISQGVWTALGLIAGGALVFVKPTQFIKASVYMYGFTFMLLDLAHKSGVSYMGQPYLSIGALNLKIVDLSAVLFLVSIAGIVFRFPDKSRIRLPVVLGLSLLPLIYFAYIGSVFPGILYFASTTAIFASARLSWKPVATFTSVGLLILSNATNTAAFVTADSFESLRTTEAHTDFIFHRMISSTPFLAILTLLAFGLLIVKLVLRAGEIKNKFSFAVFNAALVMISLGTFWGLASGVGFVPMPQTGVNLPFVSYGGSLMVGHFALVGILLGAIRRRTLSLGI